MRLVVVLLPGIVVLYYTLMERSVSVSTIPQNHASVGDDSQSHPHPHPHPAPLVVYHFSSNSAATQQQLSSNSAATQQQLSSNSAATTMSIWPLLVRLRRVTSAATSWFTVYHFDCDHPVDSAFDALDAFDAFELPSHGGRLVSPFTTVTSALNLDRLWA
jgi:hypothetical protein